MNIGFYNKRKSHILVGGIAAENVLRCERTASAISEAADFFYLLRMSIAKMCGIECEGFKIDSFSVSIPIPGRAARNRENGIEIIIIALRLKMWGIGFAKADQAATGGGASGGGGGSEYVFNAKSLNIFAENGNARRGKSGK